LVRHAETDWNQAGKIQGQVNTSSSEKGLAQAKAISRRLAETPIHAAYASDLNRAAETAQAIMDGRTVNLCLAPELREFSYGEWEGMTYQEIKRLYSPQFSEMLSRCLDFAPPGGESMNQLIDRVSGFLARMPECYLDETVLLVAHGGSLRAAVVSLLGLPRRAAWSLWLGTASLSIIDIAQNNSVLRLLNDTSHLGMIQEQSVISRQRSAPPPFSRWRWEADGWPLIAEG
jgi:broad specificity phosphatase PhoE